MIPKKCIKYIILLLFILSEVHSDDKSSLTFVIDDTYSMDDEINQVKAAVNDIFDTVLNYKDSQIEDFVLVTFNDPEPDQIDEGIVLITNKRKEFKDALFSIKVHGGGKCPEPSMSGITKGIINSRPGSTIYVFTDASAKDYKLYNEVKNMAISKQIQVVFVLTGKCNYDYFPIEGYKVYHSLADDTVGQVFNLGKNDVKEILIYVKENIKGRRATLGVAKFPPGTHSLEVELDILTKGPTVSATGVNPALNITGPDGKADTKTLVHKDNISIVKIQDPKPGVYNVEVSSPSDTHVVVTARTDVKFRHGFSTSKASSIEDTFAAPNPDVKSHVIIKLTDGAIQLMTVKILGMDGKVIKETPLVAINEIEKLYTTDLEDLPDKTFKLAITGIEPKSGDIITRVGSPIIPTPRPKHVDMPPSVSVVGSLIPKQALQLNCTVKGYPKPNIVWVNSEGVELPATESAVKLPNEFISILVIDIKDSFEDYECRADNSMGSDSASFLTETIPHVFTILRKPKDISINYHDEGELHCEVDAYPPATITWYKDRRHLMTMDDIELAADNSSLKIKKMHPSHDGSYLCEVRNEYNRKILTAKVTITGVENPVIHEKTKAKAVPIGTDTVITCKLFKGFPKPTITWFFSDVISGQEKILNEWSNAEAIKIQNANKSSAGIYSCLAKNEIGTDYHELTLAVEYPPKIEEDVEHYSAAEGETIKMSCSLEGTPVPEVTWYKDNVTVTERDQIYININHSIKMTVGLNDSGTYTCNATNKYGTASRTVYVDVNVPVTITLPKTSNMEVEVGSTLHLPCQVKGFPTPTTEWIYYSFNQSVNPKRVLKSLGSSSVPLRNIQIEEMGYYTCTASNSGGQTNITYEIHVTARPKIEQIYMNKNFKAVEGDLVLLIKCNASGSPPPDIRWLKNGYWVATGDDFSIENGTFIMKNISQYAAGYYVCEAKNRLGYDRELYEVTVDKFPLPDQPTLTVSIGEGSSSAVQCDVPHKRTDQLRWYKNGSLIHTGELTLTNARVTDSGVYTCRVSDFAKSTSGNTLVKVGYRPRFVAKEEENIEYTEGTFNELSCEAYGDPEPVTTWWHNGELMNTTDYNYYFEMDVDAHGHYECESRNDFGTVTRSFNVSSKDCLINIKKQSSKLQPLMVSTRASWLQHDLKNGYMSIPKHVYLGLSCPSRFKNFPQRYVMAFCKGGSKFIIQGKTYEYSDIECSEKVTHFIENSGKSCSTHGNTELLSIVFQVPSGSITAYDVCFDTDNNKPVYTTLRMRSSVADISYSETEWADKEVIDINLDEAYECLRQNDVTSTVLQRWFHMDDQCCFSKRMLVSPQDLFPGVAQSAAYSHLNVVPHWSTCNSESNNWNDVEQRVRTLAKATYSELVVSTGVAENLTLLDSYGSDRNIFVVDRNRNRQAVPKYIWKVVQEPDTKSSLVIIQVNVPDLEYYEAARYVRCRDICNITEWMKGATWYDVRRGFTYCCTLEDFENSFGFGGVFEPYYQVLNDVSLIPEYSLT